MTFLENKYDSFAMTNQQLQEYLDDIGSWH